MADPLTLQALASQLAIPLPFLLFILVWSLVWKALALWKSARLNQPIWFIFLLVINTLGVFEILYIFLFSKIDLNKRSNKSNKSISIRKSSRIKKKK